MITEDYVSFEIAKLLKEKGFDESTIMRYDSNGEISSDGRYGHYNSLKKFDFISAPTLQMAMKWLREEHNIHVEVRITNHSFSSLIAVPRYYWIIFNAKEVKWMDESTVHESLSYKTFEQPCEAAIKYCLENLI